MTKYRSLHFRVLDTSAYLLGCQDRGEADIESLI